MEFEILFTDITILEAQGFYEKVAEIMNKERLKYKIKDTQWVVRSDMTINSSMGFSKISCGFYDNGSVIISDYLPMIKDINNTDIRNLTAWCNEKGWKTPQPVPSLVDAWTVFWRKEWETYIIESDYLESKFGARKEITFVDKYPDDDESEE